MKVEVVYAKPEEQALVMLDVAPGSTVIAAIQLSGLLERYPEIDLASIAVGIFGELTILQTELREGDRVEIYRPLQVDPKDARVRRARKPTKKKPSA
jgi:putative ubiquitin-RnfH superfamily antitoxin RatB of RatAB toxin-antitoxin module